MPEGPGRLVHGGDAVSELLVYQVCRGAKVLHTVLEVPDAPGQPSPIHISHLPSLEAAAHELGVA